jgi:hypothetical protein
MGHFALADGSLMEFPPSLTFDFDVRAAIASGAITEIKHSADCKYRARAFRASAFRNCAGFAVTLRAVVGGRPSPWIQPRSGFITLSSGALSRNAPATSS